MSENQKTNETEQEVTQQQSNIRSAKISAHRGGPISGFPENALETLIKTAEDIPNVMVEIDIRETKDNVLVLLHDETLDRTTTMSSNIQHVTYGQISTLTLEDSPYTLPTLYQVLQWLYTEPEVYLSLDVKERELFDAVLKLVEQFDLLDQVEFITYTLDAAKEVYALDQSANISMTIRNPDELMRVIDSGIPGNQVSAFTGLSLSSPEFYTSIKDYGAVVTLGTIGNLDQKAASSTDQLYVDWFDLGVDRIATDRPRKILR